MKSAAPTKNYDRNARPKIFLIIRSIEDHSPPLVRHLSEGHDLDLIDHGFAVFREAVANSFVFPTSTV